MIPAVVTDKLTAAAKLIEARELILTAYHAVQQVPGAKSALSPSQLTHLDEMIAHIDVCVVSLIEPQLLPGGHRAST